MTLPCRICGKLIEVEVDAINEHHASHQTFVEPTPTLRALLAYWWRRLRWSRWVAS